MIFSYLVCIVPFKFCHLVIDAGTVDQFGVLHDGANPLAGAIDGVRLLKEKNKSIVILSNTSSRASTAVKKFIEMGFPPDIPFVTSGEIAWNYLGRSSIHRILLVVKLSVLLDTHFRGKKCTWITWRRHAQDNYLKSLQIQLASVQEADFIFFHGTQTVVCDDSNPSTDMSTSVFSNGVMDEPLREVLSIARARNIPAICANMDLTAVLANGRTAHMPGLLKALYEDMGGEVISFGKPQKEFFETAISIASKALETSSTVNNVLFTKKLKSRTIHVGDSLHHDIQGMLLKSALSL